MAQTWRYEIKCPYCGEDLTRMHEKARIVHKNECHIRRTDEHGKLHLPSKLSLNRRENRGGH